MRLISNKKYEALTKPPPLRKMGKASIEIIPSPIEAAKVQSYRDAVQAARNQRYQSRTRLYDFYSDAMDFDSHLKGLAEKRFLSTVGRKLVYTDAKGEPIEKMDDFIQSPPFERLRREFLERKVLWGMGLFGFEAIEVQGQTWLQFENYPLKHVDPYEKMIRKTQNSTSNDDESFDGVDTILFVGDKDGLGLLQHLALLAVEKRELQNAWRTYVDDAGVSFRNYKMRGDADNKQIQDAINKIGARQQVSLEGDVDISVENASSTSQNQLFIDRMEWIEASMTKLMLGQTMTTEDGASRSQAEVHERVQDTIFDSDAKAELDFLNYDFYDIAVKYYGFPAGGKFQYVGSGGLKQMQAVELDLKLKELGYIFSQEYLAETYGKPKPQQNANSQD